MAMTDGEDPERWWAHINPVSMSTRLMGPGSRLDTIDDHAAAWNWQKIRGFGDSLAEKLRVALILSEQHSTLHTQFTASFPDSTTKGWEKMVKAWEVNPSRANPFNDGVTHSTVAEVRLALAQEETLAPPTIGQETSLHMFVYQGLELEEDQRALEASIKEKTTIQAVEAQEKRNALARRIVSWCGLQAFYMPIVQRDVNPSSAPIPHSERFRLQLPSQLPPSPELALVQSVEVRLRVAQADDALAEIRRLLRISAGLRDHKQTQIGYSQQSNTRMRAVISRYHSKLDLVSNRYRVAYKALVALDEGGDWKNRLLELKPEDVRWPAPVRTWTLRLLRRAQTWIKVYALSGLVLEPGHIDGKKKLNLFTKKCDVSCSIYAGRPRGGKAKPRYFGIIDGLQSLYFNGFDGLNDSYKLLALKSFGYFDVLYGLLLLYFTSTGLTVQSHCRHFNVLDGLLLLYFNVFDVTSTFLTVPSNCRYFDVFDVTSAILMVRSYCDYFDDFDGSKLLYSDEIDVTLTKFTIYSHSELKVLINMFSELKSKVSLSLDAWTSSNQHAFLVIVAHFVANDGVLEEVLIDFQEIIGAHSGANLAAVVWKTMNYFGLVGKVPFPFHRWFA
ncbi:hypothetical protein ONZ45_g11524 [Pleurotus djamor]|nr:hypothetical protein ONZ45_g11524 [Pleurotus djamor]